jgi:hypothetical protein
MNYHFSKRINKYYYDKTTNNKNYLQSDIEKINLKIENLKKKYNEIDFIPEKILLLLKSTLELRHEYLLLITSNNFREAKKNYYLKRFIPRIDYNFFTVLADLWDNGRLKSYTEAEESIYQKEKKIYDIEDTKALNFVSKLEKNHNDIIYLIISAETTVKGHYFDVNEKEYEGPDFSFLKDLEISSTWFYKFRSEDIKHENCKDIIDSLCSKEEFNNYEKKISEHKVKINSETFKKNLKNNFERVKIIIKNVILNKLLGERNVLTTYLNKILDKESHNQRLENQKIKKGYIYILTNKSFSKWLKIGSTMRDPTIRAQELSNTSVPYPYEVKFKILTKNCEILEKKVHNILSNKVVDLEREFFNCDLSEAISIIEKAVKENN